VTAFKRPHKAFWRIGAAMLVVAYFLGFAFFVYSLPAPGVDSEPGFADAIVVLTGEGLRLETAAALLEHGYANRMLITGVYPSTTKEQLKTLAHGNERFSCCADLGFEATDTRGNAEEAARWVQAHGYRSLILVTSSYHMPRSLMEFSAALSGTRFIPYPVPAVQSLTGWRGFMHLQEEYLKYLASLARIGGRKLALSFSSR
jgi:uncharacterized SAM-binding protein YcdF (DUF218 family)